MVKVTESLLGTAVVAVAAVVAWEGVDSLPALSVEVSAAVLLSVFVVPALVVLLGDCEVLALVVLFLVVSDDVCVAVWLSG